MSDFFSTTAKKSTSETFSIRVSSPIPDATDRAALAYFTTVSPSPSTVIVAVVGDIDASNSDALASYAISQLRSRDQLILDLTNVKYFGAEGYSALQQIATAGADMVWAVVPGREVTRLLRIVDPNGEIASASTVEAAEALLADLTGARRAGVSTP